MQVGGLDEDAGVELRDLITSGVGSGVTRRVPDASDIGPHLLAAVQRRLDEVVPERDRALDEVLAWRLVLDAVDRVQQDATADRDYLLAARHLLARGVDPRDPSKPAPYDDLDALAASAGMSGPGLLRAAGGLKPGAQYASAISLRRTYAARVVGLPANRDAFKPGKRTGADEVMRTVCSSLERTLASEELVREAVASETSACEDGSTESVAGRPARRRGGWVRRWWWLPAAGCLVLGATIAAMFIATRGPAIGLTEPLAKITTHTAAELQQTPGAYWVPADASIGDLAGLTGTCQRGSLGAWLAKHGQPQESITFTVSNTQSELLGVTNVVAHGQTSAATPGLWIDCKIGGGDLDWDNLSLEMRDGAVAHFADGRANTFFWHSVDPGDMAGVSVVPQGSLDFTGTVTVDVSTKGHDGQSLPVPKAGTTTALRVTWHGAPAGRMLTVTPTGDGTLYCRQPGAATDSPCSVAAVRDDLRTLWGLQ